MTTLGKKAESPERKDGLSSTVKYIQKKQYMRAFALYKTMLENPDSYLAPPKELTDFIFDNIDKIQNAIFLNIEKDTEGKSAQKHYQNLKYLSKLNEKFDMPKDVKNYLVTHAYKIDSDYFQDDDNKKSLNSHDPLYVALNWYCHKHKKPTSTLNRANMILATMYSNVEDITLLSKVIDRLSKVDKLEVEYINFICSDVLFNSEAFVKGIHNRSEIEKFKYIQEMFIFLLQTSSGKYYFKGELDLKAIEVAQKEILESRLKLAQIYFRIKETIDEHDWKILNEKDLLLNLDPSFRDELIEKAINKAQAENEKYFEDKDKWWLILFSKNEQAIQNVMDAMSSKELLEYTIAFDKNESYPNIPPALIKKLSENQEAIIQALFQNRKDDDFNIKEAYYNLQVLSKYNPNLTIPNEIKQYLALNFESLYDLYFDRSKIEKHFIEKDPLVISLKWYSQLNLPRGTLNNCNSALAALYADARDPKLFSKVNEHLRACSFINLKYLNFVRDDFEVAASDFANNIKDHTEQEIKQFNDDLLEFLILTNPEQRFVHDELSEEDIEEYQDNLRFDWKSIAKIYHKTKQTSFSEKDWFLLNDIRILKHLDNKKVILQKAIKDTKEVNKDYYMDRNKWLGILLSGDKEEIHRLKQYVIRQDSSDISFFARVHEMILKKEFIENKKEKSSINHERLRLLRHAALRGDNYALGKLSSFKKTKPEKNEAILYIKGKNEEIDKHLALLYQAKDAKGIARLKFLGFGSKQQLSDKILELKRTKDVINAAGDLWIEKKAPVEEIATLKENVNVIVLRANKDYKRRQQRFYNLNALYDVLSLGVVPLRRAIKQRVANRLFESASMKSSGYQFWDKNYFAVIDGMNDIPESCNNLIRSEKKLLKSAETKLKIAKNKVDAATNALKEEKKTFLGRVGFVRTARNELVKAKQELALAEKLKYRAERNRIYACENSYLSDNYPGLEIEQRTILTDDGAKLDVLVINNKQAQAKNPGQVKDIIHFSGRGCFFKQDFRHFEHAVAKGCNLIVVQDRLTSSNSNAVTASQETLAKDGASAVKHIIKMRKNEAKGKGQNYAANVDPIINGYCGGGPISVLTHEALQKEGLKLKFLGDRTFRSMSGMLEGWFEGSSRLEKFKRWGTQLLAKPLLKILGWDVDVAGKIGRIPEDQKIYVDINAPEGEESEYFKDKTINKEASVHTGLENQRKKKLAKLEGYHDMIMTLKGKITGSDFKGNQKHKELILACIEDLSKTIHYVHSSYDITQVKAKEDNAHVDATKNFLLRDNTPHDDRIFEFIHNPTEQQRTFFAPSRINENDPLKDALHDLWLKSASIFNEFYDNGKMNVELKHADYDIRHRINALIYAINLQQLHETESFKGEQQKGLSLQQNPRQEFISPELPKTMGVNQGHPTRKRKHLHHFNKDSATSTSESTPSAKNENASKPESEQKSRPSKN